MSTSSGPPTRRTLEVLFVILVAGLLLYRFGPELTSRAGIPTRAPDLELATVSGDTVRMADLRGSVVLVNFWATWCAPCRVEMPILQRVWEEYRDRGFVVLGLYTDQGPVSDLLPWFRELGVRYPFARATGAATRGFGLGDALPTSFLVDRHGRVVERVRGIYPEDALRRHLDRYLAAEPTAEAPE